MCIRDSTLVVPSIKSTLVRNNRNASAMPELSPLDTTILFLDSVKGMSPKNGSFILSMSFLPCTFVSVSYTHLDVYKRQVIPCAASQNTKVRLHSMPVLGSISGPSTMC